MTFARDQLLQSVDHVNALKRKNFLRAPVPMLSRSEAERSIRNKAVFPMSSPRVQANPQSSLPFGEEAKTIVREEHERAAALAVAESAKERAA